MLTIKQHLSKLPSPYKEMALANTSAEQLEKKYLTAHTALSRAFVWSNTEEGWQFWYAVFCDAMDTIKN